MYWLIQIVQLSYSNQMSKQQEGAMAEEAQHEDNTKDEFMFEYIVAKVEERKILKHPLFEQVTSKYWQLLQSQPGADLTSDTITKKQYIELMKRVYMLLAPIYREEEMNKEILQEWRYDSRGQDALTPGLFMKLLFRIAHQWAPSIDTDEYVELLTKIYERITVKQITRSDGSVEIALPSIQVDLFQKNLTETKDEEVEWESCDADDNESDYAYKVIEDPTDKSKLKSMRQRKTNQQKEIETTGLFMSIREPFYYKEQVVYFTDGVKPLSVEDTETDCLAEFSDVLPFGYPVEQFIASIKNDVHFVFQKLRQDKKKAFAAMRRELMEGNSALFQAERQNDQIDRDPGFLEEKNELVTHHFSMHNSVNPVRIKTCAVIKDSIYNQLRQLLKEAVSLQIRLHLDFPGAIKNRPTETDEFQTVVSKFGYNPTLERRLNYKLSNVQLPTGEEKRIVNVHYLIADPVYETAYRSDVRRVETKDKMAIRAGDHFQREEEFVNVTSSFREAVTIMMVKKFDTFFKFKMQEEEDTTHSENVFETELTRKMAARMQRPIAIKQLEDPKVAFSDPMKTHLGPFYNLISKRGPEEDEFVTCGVMDLIESANCETMRILMLGKPRSGKTTLTNMLCKSLDLVRINSDVWIAQLFARIKDREENPPEESEPEEIPEDAPEGYVRPPKKWLNDSEEEILRKLMKGDEYLTLDDHVYMISSLIQTPIVRTKGFILDLDLNAGWKVSWLERIYEHEILGKQDFTHIVELEMEDDEVKRRALGLRQDLSTGIVYSEWERLELAKPKKYFDEDGEEIELDEEDERYVKPLEKDNLITRVCDERVVTELDLYFNYERNLAAVNDLIGRMWNHTYIKIEAAGLTPTELAEVATFRLKPSQDEPLRPIAHIIEGGAGDFKQLLTEGIEEEGVLPRQWSLWRTIDPVELYHGKVEQGQSEFAAHFANNVFVFVSEENLQKFVKEPKMYISTAPQMPPQFRILMLGPRGSGVHTQAKILENFFGWRVVDFQLVVQQKLAQILAMPEKLPNNVTDIGPCMVCLSNEELIEIKEGKPFPSYKFLPWILEFLGVPLMQRPPAPPVEVPEINPEELTEEERKAFEKEKKKKEIEEQKRLKEEAESLKAKEDRAIRRAAAVEAGMDLAEMGLEESEEEIKIDDLPIDQLTVAVDEDGNKPVIDRFILIGFPYTELHIEKLKEVGIGFDRIIYLNDLSEEDDQIGQSIAARMKANAVSEDALAYDWDYENSRAQATLAVVKEFLGDSVGEVKEIDCNGSADDVFIKIRTSIDPFFILPDNPDEARNSGDLNLDEEEENPDKRLPRSDFGDYCPVTFVKDGFLVKGDQEFELTLYGKTFRFAGEKEQELFKFDPSRFLIVQDQGVPLPLQPPAPKIMITGEKGSGVTSQIQKLCDKYKLEPFELLKQYLAKMKEEKNKRKRIRLLKRGFKPAPPEEEGEDAEPFVDPEIEDDPDDFEKEEHEKELMKTILDSKRGLVIDGHWTTLPEETVTLPLTELLQESRRMPEIVVILRCKEATTFKRCLDTTAIEAEFNRLMDKRAEEARKRRAEDRSAKLEELIAENKAIDDENADQRKSEDDIQREMAEWDATRDEEDDAADENDPDKPVLADMLEEAKEKLREQREKDTTHLEEFVEFLKSKNVTVHELVDGLNSENSSEYIFKKIEDKLKPHLQLRNSLIEREQAQILKPKEVHFYEKSYTFKHSKFGLNSPLSPFNPRKSKNFAVLYRERIFFLSNAEEQRKFMLEPSRYTMGVEAVPRDLNIKPKLVVLGLPKSGKSGLCKTLSDLTGAVHLQVEEVIQMFVDRDAAFAAKLRTRIKSAGKEIDDSSLVNLLERRVQMKDCAKNGWVLEGFPQTRKQAKLMVQHGLIPQNVISIGVPVEEVYKRTEALKKVDFGCDRTILSLRLKYQLANLSQTTFFFRTLFENVTSIDGTKSRWFMQDVALEAVQQNLQALMEFSRDFFFKMSEERPCKMQHTNLNRFAFKQSLSQYGYICPVSWKVHKRFVNCTHRPENTVLFKNFFYYFANQECRDVFIKNPERFVEKVIFSSERNCPLRLRPHKAAELISQDKHLLGHCPVTLKDDERVEKGNPLLTVQFKENRFLFVNEEKLSKFYANPTRYATVQLPVKMPASVDQVSLYQLQTSEKVETFLEEALGSVVTHGLREVGENRLKYPTLTVKETMLKLFALFLKAENPANTQYMKEKYRGKMKKFIERCELPTEIHELAEEKKKKEKKGRWPQFKENYYNELGAQYDRILLEVKKEKAESFACYMK